MNIQKIPSIFLFVTLAVSISLIGCSSTSGTDDDNDPPPANEVQMQSQSFSPSSIQIELGTTVTWVNESSMTHTVTSGTNGEHDGKFDSGNVAPGEEFSYTFDETGEFPYYCIPHLDQGMTGTVTVIDSSGDNGDY